MRLINPIYFCRQSVTSLISNSVLLVMFFFQVPFIQHGKTIISLLNSIDIKINKRTGFSMNYFFFACNVFNKNGKNHVIKKKSIHYTCDLSFLMYANVTVRKKKTIVSAKKICSFSHIFSFPFIYSICQWPCDILYKTFDNIFLLE